MVPQFMQLMRHATARDWLWIERFSAVQKQVYIFLPDNRECAHPVGDYRLPWPIVYLLGRYHRKHLFMSRAVPKLRSLGDAVTEFENKLRWKWSFRKSEVAKPSILVKSRTTPKFIGGSMEPMEQVAKMHLEAVLRNLRAQVMEQGEQLVAKARASKRTWCNTPPLVSVALKLMKDLDITALPTDKDGGFCLISRSELGKLRKSSLESEQYEEVQADANMTNVANKYVSLCKKVGEYMEEENLAGQLTKSLFNGKLCGVLKNTIKTHKAAGAVSLRPIHATSNWAFKGLAMWVTSRLRIRNLEIPHVVKSGQNFVQSISKLVAMGNSTLFVKLDLKDFFLSGTPDQLVRDCIKGFAGAESKLMEESLDLLLWHQYITAGEFPDRKWRSRIGSGMGLVHSGDLMDWVFYSRCEKWFSEFPGTLWSHGISRYYRYRDDILILGTTTAGVRDFLEEMRSRASYFVIGVDEASRDGVKFLNVKVSRDGRHFRCAPFTKCTALLRPLDVSSMHVPHVHLAWPKAQVASLGKLANSEAGVEEAKQAFISRMRHFAAPNVLLRVLQDTESRSDQCNRGRSARPTSMWIRLPYHPVWFCCLNRLIGKFSRDDTIKALFFWSFDEHMPCLRIAWCNAVQPLTVRVST